MASKGRKRKPFQRTTKSTKQIRPKQSSITKEKNTETPRKPITGPRLWIFRIIAVTVIPVLLLLLLEITLRAAGYGYNTEIAVKHKINNIDSYFCNIKFAWRFFPPTIARTANPFVFPVKKSEQTYRIFVMGASAAAGTPEGSFSLGRQLQVMLKKTYPQVNFEIITTAMPAINSHAVLQIAEDCSKYQSDMFIVYLGNNEVVGPYGAGTVFTPLSSNISLIRLGIALKATRIGQLITNLSGLFGGDNAPKVWLGLKMFLDKQVRVNDESLQIVYKHFQRNLEDIRDIAAGKGIKIIFCTVPVNLKDCPPFASLHRPNLKDTEKQAWDELYQQGTELEAAGNYAGALERYLKAAEIDSCFADLEFRLGHCYWTVGEYDNARERYIMARELDTLRFRADNQINEIIRRIAGDMTGEGVHLVDAVKLFDANSPHEIPGRELFYEHVHINFSGTYLLAGAIFEQVEQILPERIQNLRAAGQLPPTESECARLLAYTAWDCYTIADKVLNDFIKQPPFTNQLYHEQQVSRMEQDLTALRDGMTSEVFKESLIRYQQAIQQNPTDWWLHFKYGGLLNDMENYKAAADEYRLVLKYIPDHYEAFAKLGLVCGKLGDLNAAVQNNLEAVRVYPGFSEAQFNLGLAYHLKGDLDKAIEHYSLSIQYMPEQSQAYMNKGLILFQQGKQDQAIQVYRDGIAARPGDLDLHYNLGIILSEQGNKAEAIKELQAALQIDPNSIKTQKVLKAVMAGN